MKWRDPIIVLAGLAAGLLTGCRHAQNDVNPRDIYLPSAAQMSGPSPFDSRTPPPAQPAPAAAAGPPNTTVVTPAPKGPPPPPKPTVKDGQDIVPTGGLPRDAAGAPPPPPVNLARLTPPPDEPLVEALRCYRKGRSDEGLGHLRKYDAPTRELLAVLLPLAARCGRITLDRAEPGELGAALEQIDLLAQMLRTRAPLAITKACLCRKIRGFGNYDPVPPDHAYRAGVDGQPGGFVVVYVELGNATSQPSGPFYETVLASTLTVRDAGRRVVCRLGDRGPLDRPVDRIRSRRRDCHLNCYFYVPPQVPPGDYTLEVEVRDLTGLPPGTPVPAHRRARKEVGLHVRGRGSDDPGGGEAVSSTADGGR